MKVWALLAVLKNELRPRRRRASRFRYFETLEDRSLLAGNVLATFANGSLTLRGDAANNTVDVTVENGNCVVRGLDGTTVNGAASFAVFNGTSLANNVIADLGGGNDAVLITNGLTIGGNVRVDDLLGNNRLALDGVTVNQSVRFRTGAGTDTLSLGNTTVVRRSVSALTRGGNDLISIANTRIQRDLNLSLGDGNDDVVINNVDILDDAKIFTTNGDDDVLIRNSRITDNLIIKTGRGADVVRIEGTSNVGGILTAWLGKGADQFETVGTNTFREHFNVVPSAGVDAVEISAGTTITGQRRQNDAESNSADTTRLDTASTGAAAAAQAALDLVSSLTLPLTVSTATNTGLVQGNGTLITRNNQFTITGTTRPGATVAIDISRPGNVVGDFSDGTIVAGSDGTFSITITLVRDATNDGANLITVRSQISPTRQRTETLNVHLAEGTIVRMETSQGNIEIELLNDDAPLTTANFLNYQARYAGTVFHRAPHPNGQDFVIQGGGFNVAGGVATQITTDAPVTNEHNAALNPNVRGTLSMATLGGQPNSGTSQWFVNIVDNASLDAATARHTVFARVIGNGMVVADAINDLREVNLEDRLTGAGASALARLRSKALSHSDKS